MRSRANRRLLSRIKEIHRESDSVFGYPRIFEKLRYEGESLSVKRIARLMQLHGIRGIPQKRKWQKKGPEQRPIGFMATKRRKIGDSSLGSKHFRAETQSITNDEYQRFLREHHIISSGSAVGSCADKCIGPRIGPF